MMTLTLNSLATGGSSKNKDTLPSYFYNNNRYLRFDIQEAPLETYSHYNFGHQPMLDPVFCRVPPADLFKIFKIQKFSTKNFIFESKMTDFGRKLERPVTFKASFLK